MPNIDRRGFLQLLPAAALALAAGATSQSPPEDKPYGHRNAGVIDPCGITWWIASPVN